MNGRSGEQRKPGRQSDRTGKGGRKAADDSRRFDGPQSLGDILSDLVVARGYANQQSAADCEDVWQAVIGEEFQGCSQTGNCRRGVLHVIVNNSTVMQELAFRKQQILNELQRRLPAHGIVDVKLKIGSIEY